MAVTHFDNIATYTFVLSSHLFLLLEFTAACVGTFAELLSSKCKLNAGSINMVIIVANRLHLIIAYSRKEKIK